MELEIGHFKNKHVLITGGLGFIGSNLAIRLHELGAKIEIIDALIPGHGGIWFNIDSIKEFLTIHTINLTEFHDNLREIIARQDFIFNLAGQSNHWDSMENPLSDLEFNCITHLNVLENARRYNPSARIIYTSTRQVYGKPVALPVSESHPVNPIDINGIHKAASEQYHTLYQTVYGLRSTTLRLTNTYGPRMRIKDSNQTFLGYWIRSVLENKEMNVWDGHQLRDFNYIDDVVDALLLCATHDNAIGKVYNLGSHEFINLEGLAKLISTIYPASFKTMDFPANRKIIDIGDYYSDFNLINNDLNWRPKIELKEGLLRTILYFNQNLAHYIEST